MEKETPIAAPAVIKAIRIKENKIEFSTNQKGFPVARYFRLMSSGKNKGQYKSIEGYYFQTEEKRKIWVEKKVAEIKSRISAEESYKNSKKEARANMKHSFEVGQIFYDSWGYDQTNIDFFKIIEVKEKSVVIQEIGASPVPGTYGHDSQNVSPNPDSVFGKPMLKIIQVSVDHSGKAHYRFSGKHSFSGSLSPYHHGEKGVYSSWGH